MSRARGGDLPSPTTRPPPTYPPESIFSLTDPTCGYSCMVGQFVYWCITTLKGTQVGNDFTWTPQVTSSGAACSTVAEGGGDVCGPWKATTRTRLETLLPGVTQFFEVADRTGMLLLSHAGVIPDGSYSTSTAPPSPPEAPEATTATHQFEDATETAGVGGGSVIHMGYVPSWAANGNNSFVLRATAPPLPSLQNLQSNLPIHVTSRSHGVLHGLSDPLLRGPAEVRGLLRHSKYARTQGLDQNILEFGRTDALVLPLSIDEAEEAEEVGSGGGGGGSGGGGGVTLGPAWVLDTWLKAPPRNLVVDGSLLHDDWTTNATVVRSMATRQLKKGLAYAWSMDATLNSAGSATTPSLTFEAVTSQIKVPITASESADFTSSVSDLVQSTAAIADIKSDTTLAYVAGPIEQGGGAFSLCTIGTKSTCKERGLLSIANDCLHWFDLT